MLDSLNPQQQNAVHHIGSPLLILAGPGSGKTKTITTKIAWLIKSQGVQAERILAMTFTNKAAKEMKERVAQLLNVSDSQHEDFTTATLPSDTLENSPSPMARGYVAKPFVSTFHSFGYYFLRKFGHKVGLNAPIAIIDDQEQSQLLRNIRPQLDRKSATSNARNIARCKDFGLDHHSPVQKLAEFFVDPNLFRDYERAKLASSYVDFSDLIVLPHTILVDNPDVRDWVRQHWSWFLIDEYQDTNIIQHKLLRVMCEHTENICVVGDDDQSIYRFRGAQIDNILSFGSHYPHTTTVKLEENYRSSPQIVELCNAIIHENSSRHGKRIFSQQAVGDKPKLAAFNTEGEEVRFIVDRARETAYTGTKLAIFYRTNAQSRLYEMELQRARIAYGIVGALSFFDRMEVKDAISLIRLYTNPHDALSFMRVSNKPTRGLGGKTQKIISEAMHAGTSMRDLALALQSIVSKKALAGFNVFVDVFDPIDERTIGSCIRVLLQRSGMWEMYTQEDRLDLTDRINNLEELISFSEAYPADADGFAEYFSQISLDKGEKNNKADAPVQLMTLHRSKGLEFGEVIICGLEKGGIPLSKGNDDDEELEEERRLFYVGASRAKRELSLTFCYSRKRYGQDIYNEPSVFLRGFNLDLIAPSHYGYSIDGIIGDKVAGGFGGGMSDVAGNEVGYAKTGAPSNSEKDEAENWKNGDRVEHSAYGKGYVREVRANKGHVILEVDFDDNYSAMFMPKYTRELKKTSDTQ